MLARRKGCRNRARCRSDEWRHNDGDAHRRDRRMRPLTEVDIMSTSSMRRPLLHLFLLVFAPAGLLSAHAVAAPVYYEVVRGGHPHDVAATPAAGGPVYYTAQMSGKLGILDPRSGKVEEISLGSGSAPHGVIVGPDGNAWVTDGGQNAILRIDARSHGLRKWTLPDGTRT
jgi:streptogramin lyase